MSNQRIIHINCDNVSYEPRVKDVNKEDLDHYFNITNDIYNEKYNLIIGAKKNYMIYQNGILLGYCHAYSYAMNIIRSYMSIKMQKNKNYKVVIKEVDNMIKVYFYEVREGYIYNSDSLIDKYRIIDIPKIELKHKEKQD